MPVDITQQFPGEHLPWWALGPDLAAGGQVAAADAKNAVAPGAPVAPGAGLGASRTLCSAETGSSLGSATCGATLNPGIPGVERGR
ncbi:hypothetical protein [Actinoplanes italicus]|uniref:hypothetical protein n=1 Tax=Actinoplanes italicus TaxID=113567 RepID=UPI0019449A7E|nr:hypothetical protein [Actinoplanes italicus]